MYKKVAIVFSLILASQQTFAQNEILLEDYFRTLKSVQVEIKNKTYNFLFDTGGGVTFVSPEIIKELGKSSYGNTVGFRMSGEKVESKLCDSLNIKIGGVNFFHSEVAVFDIMSLLPEEFKRIDGLISLKTFEYSKITLNLSTNKLILETEDSFKEKTKSMDLIPSRFANGLNGSELNIFLGTKAKNRTWWFLFDSGNIAKTKISTSTAKEWGFSPEEDKKSEIESYRFEIASDSLVVPIVVDSIIYDGAFGFDFIQQSEFLISFEDSKIWKKRSKQ